MEFATFVGMLFQGVLAAEAPAAIGWVESKIPGAMGAFAKFVTSLPATQGLLSKLEQEAGSEVSKLIDKGLGALQDEIKAHIHGHVGAFLDQEIGMLKTKVTFTEKQAEDFTKLVGSGKWDEVVPKILQDMGLS